ncbi:hypothetical protein [Mesorhizobium sp. L-2-11]|uniref:hypothetical protein n=1 Tax=Mesorhizobium sp. L-2-11 TaxID=2744521 RepID=UPI00192563EF|nr:hypothetical protein [Mesorhizobium sp. L-2-11]BCH14975.1 hypothetical protein MesoLjLa_18260 [Mesorhizobium sp. L-2-11]
MLSRFSNVNMRAAQALIKGTRRSSHYGGMAIRSEEGQNYSREREMAGSKDDDSDTEWTGRPQDDPRYIAAATAARQAYRAKYPPVNCWIDSVHELDLYLDGRHRARVLPDKATAHLLDDDGNVAGSFIYLRSETPFDAVEKHLGIDRVTEIRDDSNEGGGRIRPRVRGTAERSAAAFREECMPSQEAWRYIRDAIRVAEVFGIEEAAAQAWRGKMDEALNAIALNRREKALAIVRSALAGMSRVTILDWQAARVDCARAAEALTRDLVAEIAGHIDGTESTANERSGG